MSVPLSFTHVKWDALNFQQLIAEKLRRQPPTAITTQQNWEDAAEIALGVIDPEVIRNGILFSKSLKEMRDFTILHMNEEFEGLPQYDEIVSRIRTLYSNTYEEIRCCNWDPSRKREFLELYRTFLESHRAIEETSFYSRHCLKTWYTDNCFTIEDLDLEIPWEKMRALYGRYGVFQIREINPDATTLIIGCGNGRFANDGNTDYDVYDEDETAFSLRHNHPRSCVTIDADPAANPTIVAFFGQRSVAPLFQGQKFNEIIVEASDFKGPIARADLEALLAPNGKIFRLDDEITKVEISLDELTGSVRGS
jgi:hypothetical protein